MDMMRKLYETRQSEPLRDAAYQKAVDAVCAAEQALLEAYPEARRLLDAFQSAQLDLCEQTAYQEFVLGVRIGMEILHQGLVQGMGQDSGNVEKRHF